MSLCTHWSNMYTLVQHVQLSNMYSCPTCTVVQHVQLSNVYSCPTCTVVQHVQSSNMYSCPTCTVIQRVQLSNVYSRPTCTVVQRVQLSNVYSCPTCTVVQLVQKCISFRASCPRRAGQVGYVVMGMKTPGEAHVGDTFGEAGSSVSPLPLMKPAKPVVSQSVTQTEQSFSFDSSHRFLQGFSPQIQKILRL